MGGFIPCESHPKTWAEIFVKKKKDQFFPSGTLSSDAGRQAHRRRQYHIGIACTTTFSQQSNNQQLLRQDSHRPTGDCCSGTRLRNLEAGAQVPKTSILNLTPDLKNLRKVFDTCAGAWDRWVFTAEHAMPRCAWMPSPASGAVQGHTLCTRDDAQKAAIDYSGPQPFGKPFVNV